MYSKTNDCLEHPLGILCRCREYQEILNKFMFYSIGSRHYSLPKMNIEPVSSAKVLWVRNRVKLNEEFSKPLLDYSKETLDVNAQNVDQIWIPTEPDLIPLRLIKLQP
ncbi:uncharacterized protein LOC105662877 [Megachile rotundata]|uniref:uncharacterized protein LOC105662877 n=1 Tax=Megachile rotundata TaxID=143995 RepID=UPI0006154165|nr:PREDICTED: uncharacterized protein LOC105662877 [Megachile rotundata]